LLDADTGIAVGQDGIVLRTGDGGATSNSAANRRRRLFSSGSSTVAVSKPSNLPWKPTRSQILAAHGGRVPDVIAPGLKVLFCGINPGLYSAAVGHHFARPGNRFWPTLHAAGFSDRLLTPFEERELLPLGYGITNIAERATTAADELSAEELISGARRLVRKLTRYRPAFVGLLGITAYRAAFECPEARLGLQAERLAEAAIWILPNPSGLNAHYQVADLARLFTQLRRAAEGSRSWSSHRPRWRFG
jgi:TDG/mug DNA glycosylase family protein